MEIRTYFCESCPLAFEMTDGGGRRLNSGIVHLVGVRGLVCNLCGTMHTLKSFRPRANTDWQSGFSELLALPKAFRSPQELKGRKLADWIKVEDFQGRPLSSSLSCNQCKTQGNLTDWEGLRQGGNKCPVCKGSIQTLGCVTLFGG